MSYQDSIVNRVTQRRPIQQRQQPARIGANGNGYQPLGPQPSPGVTFGLIATGILLVAAFGLIVALAVTNASTGVVDPVTQCRFPNQAFLDARNSLFAAQRKHAGGAQFIFSPGALDFNGDISKIADWPDWTEEGVAAASADYTATREALRNSDVPDLSEYQRSELFAYGSSSEFWFTDLLRHRDSPANEFSLGMMCGIYYYSMSFFGVNVAAQVGGLDNNILSMNNFAASLNEYGDFLVREGQNGIVMSQVDADLYPSTCNRAVEDGTPITDTIQYAPFAADGTAQQQADAQAAIQTVRDAVAAFLAKIEPGTPYYNQVLALRPNTGSPGLAGVASAPGMANKYPEYISKVAGLSDSPADIHAAGLAQVALLQADLVDKVKTYLDPTLVDFADFKDRLENDPAFRSIFVEEITVQEKIDRLRLDQFKVYESLELAFQRINGVPFSIFTRPGFQAQQFGSGTIDDSYTGTVFLAGGTYFENSGSATSPVNFTEVVNVTKGVSEGIAWHEGFPGHAFQIGMLQNNPCTPDPIVASSGAVEGWAMYSEILARDDLGRGSLPDNIFNYLGGVSGRLFRAMRMVVDTGLHALGWSYDQAFNYAKANTFGTSDAGLNSEMRRYSGWPGQALGYLPNGLIIEAARAKAESELGGDFVLAEWHDVLLRFFTPEQATVNERTDWYIQAKQDGTFATLWPPSLPQPEGRNLGNILDIISEGGGALARKARHAHKTRSIRAPATPHDMYMKLRMEKTIPDRRPIPR